jgi:hypothetical protein
MPVRAALVLAALLAGCSGGSSGAATVEVGGEPVSAARLAGAAAGLCQATEEARSDVDTARTTFYDRSHADVHVIARALEDVDRTRAGRILLAKQRVEAELLSGGSPTLPADLRQLFVATRAGLRRLDVSVPDC